MGFFPTDAVNDQEVGPNTNGSFFKYVAADNKWILIPNADVYSEAEIDALNHDHFPNPNGNAEEQHMTAAQIAALHAKQHAMDSATFHTSSDIATLNASTTKHGFLKKLDNNALKFMNGQGNWAEPAGSLGNIVYAANYDGAGGALTNVFSSNAYLNMGIYINRNAATTEYGLWIFNLPSYYAGENLTMHTEVWGEGANTKTFDIYASAYKIGDTPASNNLANGTNYDILMAGGLLVEDTLAFGVGGVAGDGVVIKISARTAVNAYCIIRRMWLTW